MKKIFFFCLFIISFAHVSHAQFLRRDNMLHFNFVLDNGFEKIDLSKSQDVPKRFFMRGTPQLYVTSKNGNATRNLALSYTALYQGAKESDMKVYTMKTPLFSNDFKKDVMAFPVNTGILIAEIRLSIVEPGANPNVNIKPAAFYLYLK